MSYLKWDDIKENIKMENNKKYLIFNYQDNDYVFSILNKYYTTGKEILIEKKNDNIRVKIRNIGILEDIEKMEYMEDDLREIIDLVNISNMSVSIIDNVFKIYSSNYKHILDSMFIKEGSGYILDIDRISELYREISNYNKYINYSDSFNTNKEKLKVYELDKIINKDTKVIKIICKNNSVGLKIDDNLYNFENKKMFNNVYLIEILKLYVDNFDIGDDWDKNEQFNKYFASINDSFYLINFEEEEINGIISFMNSLWRDKKYRQNISMNCEFISDDYNVENNEVKKFNYSYGYINILLISFIISIITIIVVLINS